MDCGPCSQPSRPVRRSSTKVGAAPNQTGTAPLTLYPSSELLRRARVWTVKRGYPEMTTATFVELRRARILPGPQRLGRGAGGGRGAAWAWSGIAYLRLLRVIRLRAKGVTDRGHQRVLLFLGGARIDPGFIRADLIDLFVRSAKRVNRQYGTEYLGQFDPTPRKLAAEVRLVVDPAMVEDFLKSYGGHVPPGAATGLREVMKSPDLARIVELMFRLTVLPEAEESLPELRTTVARLPRRVAEIIGGELEESARTMAGLLAHPDVGNAMVESLAPLTDEDLVVLRDYVLAWPGMIHGLKEVMATLPNELDSAVLSAVAGLLSQFASALSLENRVMMLGFFIARAGAVPSFIAAARRSTKMRPGPVLKEMVRRGLLGDGAARQQLEQALAAAGVAIENWHFWLDPLSPPASSAMAERSH